MRTSNKSPQLSEAKGPNDAATKNSFKLWRAVKAGQFPRVKYLLKIGVNLEYQHGEGATTSLHQAALNGHKDILGALLEAGASVDDEDNDGATALHLATRSDIVEILIAAGADLDHEDHAGKTPGRRALDRHDKVVVNTLLDGGAQRCKIYDLITIRRRSYSELPAPVARAIEDSTTLQQSTGQASDTPTVDDRDTETRTLELATELPCLETSQVIADVNSTVSPAPNSHVLEEISLPKPPRPPKPREKRVLLQHTIAQEDVIVPTPAESTTVSQLSLRAGPSSGPDIETLNKDLVLIIGLVSGVGVERK